MVDVEFISKKHRVDGWSIRKISRHLQLARQTVRKALAQSEPPRYQQRQPTWRNPTEKKGKLVWCAVPPEGDIVPATTEVDARARRQLRDESAGGGVEGVGCADGDAEWNTTQPPAVRDDIVAREVSHVVERPGRTIC